MIKFKVPVVIIWLDCLARDVFVNMYRNGDLQNLSNYFADGVFVENVITCFPTVSESAEGGIISGYFSGETNMIGERYFSRKSKTIKHYKYNAEARQDFNPKLINKTIDAIIGESIGMGRIIHTANENIEDLKALQYERKGSLKIVKRRIEIASRIVLSRKPRLFFFTVSADYISHVYGRNSAEVKEFIKEFDKNFLFLAENLDEAYGKDNYLIFIFSDHGSANVSRHLDLTAFLVENGFNPATTDLLIERKEVNCAALSNSRRMGLLYFAHPEYGWSKKISYKQLRSYRHKGEKVDLLKMFASLDGVEQAFAKRDSKSVMVVSRDGEGLIQYDSINKKYKYTVLEGSDPLGYEMEPAWMSEEEWLRATFCSEYPDAVVQLYNMFKSRNCGDIVLNAASDWDFWEPWDISYPVLKASHGGLSKDEMATFLLAKAPFMKKATLEYARLIDIFATIAAYYNAGDLVANSHAVERIF